jgi:hypothetical protein
MMRRLLHQRHRLTLAAVMRRISAIALNMIRIGKIVDLLKTLFSLIDITLLFICWNIITFE